MTKLLDLLATGSVVTEEKQHLQELRAMINRLSPHRTPTITLKDTVIRDKPTDSVSWRSSRFLCFGLLFIQPNWTITNHYSVRARGLCTRAVLTED